MPKTKQTRRQARQIAKRWRTDMRRYGSYIETDNLVEGDPNKITGAYIRRHFPKES